MFARAFLILLISTSCAVADDLATDLSVARIALGAAIQASEGADRNARLVSVIEVQDRTLTIMREAKRKLGFEIQKLEAALDQKINAQSHALGAVHSIQTAPQPLFVLNPGGPLELANSVIALEGLLSALAIEIHENETWLTERKNLLSQWTKLHQVMAQFYTDTQQAQADYNRAKSARVDLPLNFVDAPTTRTQLADAQDAVASFALSLREEVILNTHSVHIPEGAFGWPVSYKTPPEVDQRGVGSGRQLGIRITPDRASAVRAPIGGTILFSGDIPGVGPMIALEPRRDLLIFLSGLAETRVAPGDLVAQGEVIALFGPVISQASDLSSGAQDVQVGIEQDYIYVEIKQNGEPSDPLRWFDLEESELQE